MPLESWPRQAGAERARLVLDAVRARRHQLDWCPIELSDGQGTLRLMVGCDALKIEGVRVTADAITQQLVADQLGAVLLTPKLYDQVYLKTAPRNRMTPHPLGEPRTSTARMVEHSALVDREVAARSASGLIANQGKAWVMTKAIFTPAARQARRAANYGWVVQSGGEASQSTPSLRVIQDIGTAHSSDYDADYSQVILLARRAALFGELPVDLSLVYTGRDPGTSLVSHEGPLPDWRQPGSDDPREPGGGPSSEPPTLRNGARRTSIAAPLVGAAATGALAVAAGAGAPVVAAAALIGAILGRRASA